jgi:hypothetical protein
MQTECSAEQFEFEGFGRRRVVAAFDGGAMTSDGGGLLLRDTDRALGLIERVAGCFVDHREQDQVVHTLSAQVGQRIVGIALGYEDVNDHDELRHDPVPALFADRLEPKRPDCAPLAGKSTLNRLEHAPRRPDDRSHKIDHDPQALANLFVDLFVEAHQRPPKPIVLDLDPTDDPLLVSRRGGSSTAITAATAICPCTCSVVGISSRPCCGPRTSTPRRVPWPRWLASLIEAARRGRRSRSSCARTRALRAMS